MTDNTKERVYFIFAILDLLLLIGIAVLMFLVQIVKIYSMRHPYLIYLLLIASIISSSVVPRGYKINRVYSLMSWITILAIVVLLIYSIFVDGILLIGESWFSYNT